MIDKLTIARRYTLIAIRKHPNIKPLIIAYLFKAHGITRVSGLKDGEFLPFVKYLKTLL